MLERFERVEKVGLFDAYVHSPGCDLGVVTVIYGENGVGKSTLVRPYLEQRLRHLFPGPPFLTRDALGDMIGKIRNSAAGSRLEVLREKIPGLEAINEASLPSHHATDDVPGMDPMTPAEVRLFALKALDVLE
jgi:hypothetical protein